MAACLIAAVLAAPASAQQYMPGIQDIDTPDGTNLKPKDVKLPRDPVGVAESCGCPAGAILRFRPCVLRRARRGQRDRPVQSRHVPDRPRRERARCQASGGHAPGRRAVGRPGCEWRLRQGAGASRRALSRWNRRRDRSGRGGQMGAALSRQRHAHFDRDAGHPACGEEPPGRRADGCHARAGAHARRCPGSRRRRRRINKGRKRGETRWTR